MVERIKSRIMSLQLEVNDLPQKGISDSVVLRNRQKYLFFRTRGVDSLRGIMDSFAFRDMHGCQYLPVRVPKFYENKRIGILIF